MFYDKVFKAIADKNRRKILNLLKKKEMTAGEIAEHFQISKPSLSGHLKILKNADLVFSQKEGLYVTYSLNTSIFEEIASNIMEIFSKKEEK